MLPSMTVLAAYGECSSILPREMTFSHMNFWRGVVDHYGVVWVFDCDWNAAMPHRWC